MPAPPASCPGSEEAAPEAEADASRSASAEHWAAEVEGLSAARDPPTELGGMLFHQLSRGVARLRDERRIDLVPEGGAGGGDSWACPQDDC